MRWGVRRCLRIACQYPLALAEPVLSRSHLAPMEPDLLVAQADQVLRGLVESRPLVQHDATQVRHRVMERHHRNPSPHGAQNARALSFLSPGMDEQTVHPPGEELLDLPNVGVAVLPGNTHGDQHLVPLSFGRSQNVIGLGAEGLPRDLVGEQAHGARPALDDPLGDQIGIVVHVGSYPLNQFSGLGRHQCRHLRILGESPRDGGVRDPGLPRDILDGDLLLSRLLRFHWSLPGSRNLRTRPCPQGLNSGSKELGARLWMSRNRRPTLGRGGRRCPWIAAAPVLPSLSRMDGCHRLQREAVSGGPSGLSSRLSSAL